MSAWIFLWRASSLAPPSNPSPLRSSTPPRKEVSAERGNSAHSAIFFLGGLSPVSKLSGFSESDLYPAPPPPTPVSATLLPARKATPTHPTVAMPTLRKTLPVHLVKPAPVDKGRGSGTRGTGPTTQSETEGKSPADGKPPADSKSPSSIGNPPRNDVTLSPVSNHSRNQSAHSNSDYFITPTSSPRLTPPHSPTPSGGRCSKRIGDRVSAVESDRGRKHETFFSSLPFKFQDIELLEGAGLGEELVPSEKFLQCCEAVLPFFGKLES